MLQKHDAYKICYSKRIKNLVDLFGLDFILLKSQTKHIKTKSLDINHFTGGLVSPPYILIYKYQ